VKVSNPGAVIRLLVTFRRLGWHKFHTYEELAEASGLSLSMVKRIVFFLEQNNCVRVRYDVDSRRKYFRMDKNSIRFTDGYVEYVFENGILDWSVEVSVP